MVRSIDDTADIYGKGRKIQQELQRAAVSVPAGRDPSENAGIGFIPDVAGAPKGILGIKAPAGVRQTGDIQDRLQAAGAKMPALENKR